MKKTLHIDADLLKKARLATGTATDTATVRMGLEALVRKAAYEHARTFWGSEVDAQDVPRRREKPAPRASRRKAKRAA
jgi:Arc/MetJ family transcription regulator